MLKRYWFILYPENQFGPRNIGVLAYSRHETRLLIVDALAKINWSHITDSLMGNAEIIENTDIRLLDQNHVIPTMGVVKFKRVWFPNLNLY